MSALIPIAPEHEAALTICERGEQVVRPWPGMEHVPYPPELVDYARVTSTLDDPRFVPLKITAHMAAAVAGSKLLMLDGPLAFGVFCAYMDRHWSERWYLPNRNSAWPADFELPVARWTHTPLYPLPSDPRLFTPGGDVWGWAVSATVTRWRGSSIEHFRGTPPVGHMLRHTGAKSVNLAAGEFKAIQLPMEAHLPDQMQLTWYALGDAQGVCDALRRVCQIGKKSRTGHGALRLDADGYPMWTVEEVGHDQRDAWWRGDDGSGIRLRRAMPAGWAGLAGSAQLLPVRTPHDHITRRHICHPAGTPC